MGNKIKTIHFSDIELEDSPSFRGRIIIGGKNYIVKKSRAITEYFTSHLMELMEIPVQKTSLAVLDDRIVVLCEDFTPKNMEFVPGFKLFKELFPNDNIEDIYGPVHVKEVFEKYLGDRAKEAFSLVFYKSIFDCIVKQEDFGPGNWGIFQGEDPCLAPFYDNAESIIQLMIAPEKVMEYAMGEFSAPFISFRDRHFEAKKGFEDITNETIERFKDTYSVERFCSLVKDTISDVSQYINIRKDAGMFLYTALVLRYLYVIEDLGEDELLEVANSLSTY